MGRPSDINMDLSDIASGNKVFNQLWVARMNEIQTQVNLAIADMLSRTDASAQTIASAITLSNQLTMQAAIAMGTNKITGLGDPTADQDAATKAWVVAQIAAFGGSLSAYTTEDDDTEDLLIDHAYKANSSGFVTIHGSDMDNNNRIIGYLATATQWAVGNDIISDGVIMAAQNQQENGNYNLACTFPIASGEYFEIVSDTTPVPTIYWRSFGSLTKPTDQD